MNDRQQDTFWQADYQAYLLRLWRVTADGQTAWRASLEYPNSGERVGFASIEALCGFLQSETGEEFDCNVPAADHRREVAKRF